MRKLVIVFVASVLVSGCAMQYSHAPVPATPSSADAGPWSGRPVLRMGMSVQINQNGVPIFVQCYDDCPSVTQKILAHSVGQATTPSGGRVLAKPTPPSQVASSPTAQIEVQARAHVEGGRVLVIPTPPLAWQVIKTPWLKGVRVLEAPTPRASSITNESQPAGMRIRWLPNPQICIVQHRQQANARSALRAVAFPLTLSESSCGLMSGLMRGRRYRCAINSFPQVSLWCLLCPNRSTGRKRLRWIHGSK